MGTPEEGPVTAPQPGHSHGQRASHMPLGHTEASLLHRLGEHSGNRSYFTLFVRAGKE